MIIEFGDKQLEELAGSSAAKATQYSISLIRSYRSKLQVLQSAPDERTLRNWKSLHYEKLKGQRSGQRSIRLNKQWRLIFELDDRTSPKTVKVLEIEDYH